MTNFSSTGPTSGDLVYRGENGFIGLVEGSVGSKPIGFAVINTTYLTDKQALSCVLGDQGLYPSTRTYLYTHSDTGHTEGVYCGISIEGIELGTYTRSGGTYVYTPWVDGAIDVPLKRGDNIEIRNTGTADADWFVLVNHVALAFPATPEADGVDYDASHRSAMISMERKNAASDFGIHDAGDYESFRIASLTVFDYVTPAFKGSGAKMKATGAGSASASSGAHILTGFFTGVDMATDDVTADYLFSKYTALIEGHYKVVLRTKNTIADGVNGGDRIAHLLYLNGSVYESGSVLASGHNGTDVTWADGLQSTWTIYLEPGDYIQPGWSATQDFGTDGFAQDSDGMENVFSIALLTRNLL